MNQLKNIFGLMIIVIFAASCEKEIDNLDKVDNASPPSNVSAIFDIAQDNSGLVYIIPAAQGATKFQVTFGDVEYETPSEYNVNETITHTYAEGVYKVIITAVGISGLTSSYEQEINVTFKAPENLVVTIEQDALNPFLVSVSATALYATIMDIYFGDVPNEVPVHAMPDSVVTHLYEEAGDYVITVVAKSGGAATTTSSDTITISEASDPVNLPVDFESFTVNYAFTDFGNVVSSVIDNPDASGINTSARVAQSQKLQGAETWAGTFLTLENPIDFSINNMFKIKVWSPKADAVVKLKVENLDNPDIWYEVDVLTNVMNEWEELSYDFSEISLDEEYQKVVIFFDFGFAGDDEIYYFDDIKLTGASPGTEIIGTWKVAPEAGALGVGETQGNPNWWSNSADDVTTRACFFDDTYVFGADGTFGNVLGDETWIEEWQGSDPPACGTPVAPHDGSVAATYTYDVGAGTVTLNGTGAYLGIPKAYNGGELTDPADAPESINYIVEFSENNTVMTVDINIGFGWWRFKLVKN